MISTRKSKPIQRWEFTEYQLEFLARNSHIVPVAKLDEYEFLCLDRGTDNDNEHYGPYVLTASAFLQDVTYHYTAYHQITL